MKVEWGEGLVAGPGGGNWDCVCCCQTLCCGRRAQQVVYTDELAVWWEDTADEACEREMLSE